jgi:hypothetical protein
MMTEFPPPLALLDQDTSILLQDVGEDKLVVQH